MILIWNRRSIVYYKFSIFILFFFKKKKEKQIRGDMLFKGSYPG